jgi:uncharacterized protein
MVLTRGQMDGMLDNHFDCESRDDVPGVLTTLTPDVVHDVVGSPTGSTYGREEAGRFYETAFADLRVSNVTSLKRYYGEDFLVDESLWEGTAPGRPFGIEGRGRPLKFRLLHVIESEDGKIRRENVWFDVADIYRQLA